MLKTILEGSLTKKCDNQMKANLKNQRNIPNLSHVKNPTSPGKERTNLRG
jgi:predicted AAA+ superfamily ATPase